MNLYNLNGLKKLFAFAVTNIIIPRLEYIS